MAHDHSNRFKQLGLNIAYYRKLRGWTQEQLAERAEISRTHLSNIEAPNAPTAFLWKNFLKSLQFWAWNRPSFWNCVEAAGARAMRP